MSNARTIVAVGLSLYLAVFVYVTIYLTVRDRRRGRRVLSVLPGHAQFALGWPVAVVAGLAFWGWGFFSMRDDDDDR